METGGDNGAPLLRVFLRRAGVYVCVGGDLQRSSPVALSVPCPELPGGKGEPPTPFPVIAQAVLRGGVKQCCLPSSHD